MIRKDNSPVNDLAHQKDPRGLVKRDIQHLEQVFKQRPIKPTMSQNEIMFQAGQQDVIRYITDKMVV
tara:strand:+ start:2977 stop:3177 length:201 start_codon:yes stop_codon:yes gene_type:complete